MGRFSDDDNAAFTAAPFCRRVWGADEGDPSATTSTSEGTTTTTSSTAAPPTTVGDFEPPIYQIEGPVEFIGQELSEDYSERPTWAGTEKRSQRYEAGFDDRPRVVYFGAFVLTGQLPDSNPFPLVVTDGLRLTKVRPGDESVYLRIQCPQRVGDSGVGVVALMWRRPDSSEVALELWDYDPEKSLLVELDPDTYQPGGCMTPS